MFSYCRMLIIGMLHLWLCSGFVGERGYAQEGGRPGGFIPEEAAARMVVPEGFRVEVFAREPMVRQPVTAAFDARGRMWVIEYLQYPNPAGLKALSVDQYLRTEYDRVPEPPPRGPQGADRIRILEDTDGDGSADRATTFVEGLNLASGLALGRGGVFVAQAPYLLFYADRDGDDRPDGDPDVLVSGFGLQDAHAVVNSLTWGPDGWLYGAQGSTVTAKIGPYEFQQGIWRYHPESRRFELFAEGGGNTWGLDFDALGRVFGSSNGGFVAFHMVQGGYYWKGFAKHGPLHNPRSFGYFDAIAYEGPKKGGHVTPGGIFYRGGAYPPEFEDVFIGGNLLSNAVYWHEFRPRGSTVIGRHGGTLLDARDTWFRPIDLLTGPDGCVYVVDWYDKRASHLDPRDNWDRSNGRIYRVAHGARKTIEPFDLERASSDALITYLDHKNRWWEETARRVMWERRDRKVLSRLLEELIQERDERRALRVLWALDACGGLDLRVATELLGHPLEGVRAWAVRRAGDEGWWDARWGDRLRALARDEQSPHVRSQLAASCQRWAYDRVLPVLGEMIAHGQDAEDPYIPLQIWWALERAFEGEGVTDVTRLVGFLSRKDVQELRLVREHLIERVARAVADVKGGGAAVYWAALLEGAPNRRDAERVARGIDKGLEGRAIPEGADLVVRALQKAWHPGKPSATMIRVGSRLGNADMYAQACLGCMDPELNDDERVLLIELLGQVRLPEGERTLLSMLQFESRAGLRMAALNAAAGYRTEAVASELLARYGTFDAAGQDRIREILASRRPWAALLVRAMEMGEIEPKSLKLAQASRIAQHADPELTARLEAVWGRVLVQGSEEKRRRIAEVRGMLPEGDKGNAARGRVVFEKHCAGCHRIFGNGGAIGPDLSGAERGDLDFLLTSLVDPSATVRAEYRGQTLALNDGRVLSGLVLEESAGSITLVDGQQQRTTVSKAEIEEMRTSEQSVMPEGLLDPLSEDEVRDLFRFLQSNP